MIWRVAICHECCLSLLVYLVVLMGNGTNTLLLILLISDEYEYWIKNEVLPSHTWLVGQSWPRSPATVPGWPATPPPWPPGEPPGSRSTIRADGVDMNYVKHVWVTDQHPLKTTNSFKVGVTQWQVRAAITFWSESALRKARHHLLLHATQRHSWNWLIPIFYQYPTIRCSLEKKKHLIISNTFTI